MTTELWFRDPLTYMNECAKVLAPRIVWEERILDQKAIDAQAQIEMHYPITAEYRILVVGDEATVELRRGYDRAIPFAVYQTWAYDRDTLDDLEEMLANPPGEDMGLCSSQAIPVASRPIFGQEHRVLITRWPDYRTVLGRSFIQTLRRFQLDYPEVIIHLWGTNAFRPLFGMEITAADFDPSFESNHGTLFLPNGRRIPYAQGIQFAQWVRMLGFSQGELATVSKRMQFNMASADWAAAHYMTDIKFKSSGNDPVDPNSHHHLPATTVNILTRSIKEGIGDKIACDSCSLFASCKYYREGAVCSLPDTDGAKLAGYFATRDSGVIIEGLGKVLATQAKRFERATEDEEFSEKGIDNNVTRLGHVLVQDGTTLAKLVDPRLAAAGAARVTAFVGGQHIHQNGTTPASLVSEVVRELEAKGFARDNITPEMVEEYIVAEHEKSQTAIEATSRE